MVADQLPFDVLAAYCPDPDACSAAPLGFGNINDTYLVRSPSHCFVLQRINSDVFPDPLAVIENFYTITEHLAGKESGARERLQVAEPVPTLNGCRFHEDGSGAFWRGQSYIPHRSYPALASSAQARRVGVGLATFHRLIRDLDGQKLSDPLPGFHNLPGYLESFDRAMQDKKAAVSGDFGFCTATVNRFRPQAATLVDACKAGILTLQPIHGDPKTENFIFDEQGNVHGLLDLDTVAMGLVHYDLGDCLRSCCNKGGETGQGAMPIAFDLSFCQALLGGYFSGSDKLLSNEQRGYIFHGVLLICFELGVRFLTDHLCGNPYFKVRKAGENLQRALNQFRLAESVAAQEREIRAMALSAGES